MKLLAQSRSLSFKARRTGDIVLRQEARRVRNLSRFELKCFQQVQLARLLKERNLPGESCTFFWSKTKRQFRTVSSSLRGFLLPNGDIIKDPPVMVNEAAQYYERLFEAPVVCSYGGMGQCVRADTISELSGNIEGTTNEKEKTIT
jgi:hypothetical protein